MASTNYSDFTESIQNVEESTSILSHSDIIVDQHEKSHPLLKNQEDVYEELDVIVVPFKENENESQKLVSLAVITGNVANNENDCPPQSFPTLISEVFHEFPYEEELDSLSLCSTTSNLDDDEESAPFYEEAAIESSQILSISNTSLSDNFHDHSVPNKENLQPFNAQSLPSKETSEFRLGTQQKLRNSILKRFSIRPWRREYHFKLESDRAFAEEDTASPDPVLTGSFLLNAPPQVPPARSDCRDEVVRRLILTSIIDSENSYVDSLFRLVQEYQEPLRKTDPPILKKDKINTIFYKIPQILQIHLMLRAELTRLMSEWKTELFAELGNSLVSLFSKSWVTDVYAVYVCNFSVAIETVKKSAKEKPLFAEFLKANQELSKDRLPIFGLLVKPVQRFPQLILQLQDLIKNTRTGSSFKAPLQLALTHLETIADCLNERKRQHEQEEAAKKVLQWAKLSVTPRNSSSSNLQDTIPRRLLAEDDFKELELTSSGSIGRVRHLHLFLLNDLLVCATISNDKSERFTPLWIASINDVQVLDEKSMKFLGYQVSSGSSAGGSASKDSSESNDHVANLFQQMADLRQDYESIKRVHDTIVDLKFEYNELKSARLRSLLNDIQFSIQVKMEEAAQWDDSILQLSISTGRSKTQKIRVILQANKRDQKPMWETLIRLSKLANDSKGEGSWDDPDMTGINCPLFLISRTLQLQAGLRLFQYTCGSYCFYSSKSNIKKSPQTTCFDGLVYLCSSNGLVSKVSILSIDRIRKSNLMSSQSDSVELLSFGLADTTISCCEWVPGVHEVDLNSFPKGSLTQDTVWFGTESGSVLVYLASAKVVSMGSCSMDSAVRCIRFAGDRVYVALVSCILKIFKRDDFGAWELKPATTVNLETAPSSSLCTILDLPEKIACAVDNEIVIVDCKTDTIEKHHISRKSNEFHIERMVRCGIGLWISYKNSPIVSLHHVESLKHLQDLDVTANVNRILAEKDCDRSAREIFVTSLLAVRGSLWIGTNVGFVVSVMLPKLDGIPVILSRPTVSLHSHCGAASVLLALQPRTVIRKAVRPQRNSTFFADDFVDSMSQRSPRTGSGNQLKMLSDDSPDVYGLYDALMRSNATSVDDLPRSNGHTRPELRRRRSLPLLPTESSSESRSHELDLRQSMRPMSFFANSSKFARLGKDSLDGGSTDESQSSKPLFVKAEPNDDLKRHLTPRHSTLIVLSAGSGYRHWRGNPCENSSLSIIGWEMKV